jgi:phosphoenolpyruvate phosphomutase
MMAQTLRTLLEAKTPAFFCEAHNAISALIAEEAGFEAIWASSLTLSASQGYRDNNELSMSQALDVLESIVRRVQVPVLFDGDTGYGDLAHFRLLAQKLVRRGIAGVCIEDKVFPKTNSLLRSEQQHLVSTDEFCAKLHAGRVVVPKDSLFIVARTEALIVGKGIDEAIERATAYAEAGADAVLVHSKAKTIDEVAGFMQRWNLPTPVVCVPTTYADTQKHVFEMLGLSGVIWANHLLRASVRAMQHTARRLKEDGARGVDADIVPVRELFRLQDDLA